MQGLMMDFPLTTNVILDYGNRVFPYKKIVSILPNKTRHAYTFSDLYKRSKQLANALHNKLGIKKGDRVATFAWNHYQHTELYYAIPGAGAVCHPLNLRLNIEQISYIIDHAEDQAIFFDASVADILEKAAKNAKSVKHYIVINADKSFTTTLPNVMHYEDLLVEFDDDFKWVNVDENDACAMCYTSGTTGNPKGVLYAHRTTYLHALTMITSNMSNITTHDTVLAIVPQFHVMGWGYPYVCLFAGATMVFPSMHLKPKELIQIIQEEKVTIANGVPTIWSGVYDELKNNPPEKQLSLKEIFVGGSALAKSLIKAWDDDFGVKAIHTWGMTETSPLAVMSKLLPEHKELSEEEQLNIKAKQGYELPGLELRIVDDNGKVLPRDGNSVGEIQIRGAWVIKSYYKQTENVNSFTDDGWFKTGDVGNISADGYMQITDRTKDLIKSGGEWISSLALEAGLLAHENIREVAVIAIPDDKWMERPLAVIVLEQGKQITIEEIHTFLLANKFAKFELPNSYTIVDDIPKTSVGKFDKKEMRRLYSEGKLI